MEPMGSAGDGLRGERRDHDPRTVVERYLNDVLNGRNPAASDELIADETFK